jgi:hypothetical protein
MNMQASTELKCKLDQATLLLAASKDPADTERIREYVRELERLYEAAADREEHKA